MDYFELEALKAEDYLNPDLFVTNFDSQPVTSVNMTKEQFAEKQYQDGIKIGKEYGEILINDRSVWSAISIHGGGVLSSSEGIGYHRNTKELLKGFIDSGAKIKVARFYENHFSETTIQENTQEKPNIKKRTKMKLK